MFRFGTSRLILGIYVNVLLSSFYVVIQKINKFKNTSFVKGFVKAYQVDLLPSKVSYFYRSYLNRIFRVIGGIATLLTLNQIHFNLYFIDNFIMFTSLVFLIQLLIINIIRFFLWFIYFYI